MEHTYNNLDVSHQEGNFQIYLDFELDIDLLEMMLHLSSDGMLDPLKFKTSIIRTFEMILFLVFMHRIDVFDSVNILSLLT